ncbi:hypothetical protein FLL45_09035 [Aliikangiella marina]|uniref:Transmembrane protein n=1 Tax=Aliikangiella marina TaxID=1712262 RepID=A0A545TCY1_9GAMM|nr:BPSS1780 family membrane protein [Aliikangiella marina]TQV75075.1 hypothetical protein FLL45_09035 [Aliikangiella marina]
MTEAQLPNSERPTLDTEYRIVPAANGILWIKRAIVLFKRNPGAWLSCSILLLFTFILVLLVIGLIPPLAPASFMLTSLYLGGLMIGSHQLYQYKKFHIQHLFAGFETNTATLCIIGLLYFGGVFISSMIGLSFSELLGFKFPTNEEIQQVANDQQAAMQLMKSLLMPTLISMGFLIPVLMAFWFAPALAVLFHEKPVEAMMKSLKACAFNSLPFLIYGIVCVFGILFLSIIVSLVGLLFPILNLFLNFLLMLIFNSILIASIYTSFEDIFPGLNHPKENSDDVDIDENSDSLIV